MPITKKPPTLRIVVEKPLEGSYVVEAYPNGSGFYMTGAGGRQVIATAETLEELQAYGRKQGAKRVVFIS